MDATAGKRVVVIGAGLAGWTVVRELRKLDKAVHISLVTADAGDFYSKPALSNALAAGKVPGALLQTPGPRLAADLHVDLIAHTRVRAIDRTLRQLQLVSSHGEMTLAWDQCVLALGANPIRLPLAGDADKVLSINHLSDYQVLHAGLTALPPGRRTVAVLGAGLIGCEFANDLAKSGYRPVVFDIAAQPLGRLLPGQIAAFVQRKLAAAGIQWHLGDPVVHVIEQEGHFILTTAKGAQVACDLVLSAVGLRPQTELPKAADLLVDRGIVVDRQLRTSDPTILAVGDCAQYGPHTLPFVLPLMAAARTAAQVLAGHDSTLQLGPLPVVVKTPDCPIVVAPPAVGAQGQWREEVGEDGARAYFEGANGQLLGMALAGTATAERQAMVKQLPAVW